MPPLKTKQQNDKAWFGAYTFKKIIIFIWSKKNSSIFHTLLHQKMVDQSLLNAKTLNVTQKARLLVSVVQIKVYFLSIFLTEKEPKGLALVAIYYVDNVIT